MLQDEIQILKAVTEGDEKAFKKLFLYYYPKVVAFIREIVKDTSKGRMVFDPTKPDANKSGPDKGYVEYPNVNIVNEMVNLISASRDYEANSTVIQGAKDMFSAALEIGRN